MNRDAHPRFHALLQAFRRIAGGPVLREALFHVDREAPAGASSELRRAEGEGAMTTFVSVVITTSGQAELLARGLAAVLAQRFDPHGYEVVVVDEAKSDEAREVVEALAPHGGAPTVRYLSCDRESGMVAARNLGWRAARGALIAFVDISCEPVAADWLVSSMQAIHAQAQAIEGARQPIAEQSDFEKLTRSLLPAESGTCNAFIRRDVLERVGGFDERLTKV